VKNAYLSPGDRIVGEEESTPGRWNTVLVEKITPTSGQ